jgi:hypothetical protein
MIEVIGNMDSKGQVDEATKENNQCYLTFTTKIMRRAKPAEVPITPPRR